MGWRRYFSWNIFQCTVAFRIRWTPLRGRSADFGHPNNDDMSEDGEQWYWWRWWWRKKMMQTMKINDSSSKEAQPSWLMSDAMDASDLESSVLDDWVMPESQVCFSEEDEEAESAASSESSSHSSRVLRQVSFLLSRRGQSAIRWSTALQWWHFFGCGPILHLAAMWFASSPQL